MSAIKHNTRNKQALVCKKKRQLKEEKTKPAPSSSSLSSAPSPTRLFFILFSSLNLSKLSFCDQPCEMKRGWLDVGGSSPVSDRRPTNLLIATLFFFSFFFFSSNNNDDHEHKRHWRNGLSVWDWRPGGCRAVHDRRGSWWEPHFVYLPPTCSLTILLSSVRSDNNKFLFLYQIFKMHSNVKQIRVFLCSQITSECKKLWLICLK